MLLIISAIKISILKYNPQYKTLWNTFLAESKNGTFLFHRDFMDYHQDRFEDFSLMVYKNEKLIAVLPASKLKKTVYSHQGLTYGGLVLPKSIKFDMVLQVFKEVLNYLSSNSITSIVLKQIPVIYPDLPSEEQQYIMFLLKAELIRRDTLSVIDLNNRIKISNNRLEGFKRAEKMGLIIKEEATFDAFWNEILTVNLQKKHQVKPVHNLDEIRLLKQRFPKNIRQFNVYFKDKIVAGTTIFETKNVAHSQYISGNEDKNQLGSLDFLHVHLISHVFKHKKYFDFGTSNVNMGTQINKGLQFWKEGFGARTMTQDFYKIETSHHSKLNDVFI